MDESLEKKLKELEKRVASLEQGQSKDQVALVVFSQELDRALAAFIIATGAAAMGQKVTMFFTFWGINVLRSDKKYSQKDWLSQMMALMAPAGAAHLPLSNMNFWGIGTKLMQKKMKDKKVASLEELIQLAKELGVVLIACEMSRDLMQIQMEELIPGLESAGVGAFLAEALQSRLTLFI